MTAAGSPRDVPPDQRTFPRLLERQAALGERLLLDGTDGALCYRDAPSVASRVAGTLAARGIGPGDRVVVMASNRLELLRLWMGAAWLGAILVPFNTAFRGAQLRHALKIARPAALACDTGFLPLFEGCADDLAGLRALWTLDGGGEPGRLAGIEPERWGAYAAAVPCHPALVTDPVVILYTSGTSGPSKAVACPHGQFYWWGVLTARCLGISPGDRLHTTLPLAHTNALNTFWQALLHGATYSLSPRFSASGFWEEMKATGATVTYLLGTMVNILLATPPSAVERAHRLRVALAPGTPRQSVAAFRDRFGVHLVDGYGSTETNMVLSNVQGPFAPGTMGRPLPEFDVRVVDEGGADVADGQAGQLLVRAREPCSTASGYFRDPGATARSWRDGWFITGDRVVRAPDGTFCFVDRMKDAIRRRGENISSWEVEQALQDHADVGACAVVGVPSPLGEEEVMAFVVPKAGTTPDPVDLVRHLETRLAYFAIPRYLEFVEALPVTDNGKITKVPLRERGIGPATWDREHAGVVLARR